MCSFMKDTKRQCSHRRKKKAKNFSFRDGNKNSICNPLKISQLNIDMLKYVQLASLLILVQMKFGIIQDTKDFNYFQLFINSISVCDF